MLVLERLVAGGNTLVIIEHNLDVMKSADHIIDLGPEGGVRGGTVVTSGTPEEVAAHPSSYTGEYLRGIRGLVPAAQPQGSSAPSSAGEPTEPAKAAKTPRKPSAKKASPKAASTETPDKAAPTRRAVASKTAKKGKA